MNKIALKTALLSLSLLIICTVHGAPPKAKAEKTAKPTPAKTTPVETITEKKIKWLTWNEMVKLNEKNPKKIFIDFYTSWCGWCKVMDRNTFEDSIVAGLMMKDFYCVKFDAERTDTIHFLNRDWVFVPSGRSGYHELAAYFMQNQLSYPTFCVLTSDFKLITPLKGYIPPPSFEPIISFLGNDFWKPEKAKNLEEYKLHYVSPRTTPWEPQQ